MKLPLLRVAPHRQPASADRGSILIIVLWVSFSLLQTRLSRYMTIIVLAA